MEVQNRNQEREKENHVNKDYFNNLLSSYVWYILVLPKGWICSITVLKVSPNPEKHRAFCATRCFRMKELRVRRHAHWITSPRDERPKSRSRGGWGCVTLYQSDVFLSVIPRFSSCSFFWFILVTEVGTEAWIINWPLNSQNSTIQYLLNITVYNWPPFNLLYPPNLLFTSSFAPEDVTNVIFIENFAFNKSN